MYSLLSRVLRSRDLRIHCRRLQEVGRNTSPTATFNVPLAGLASRQGRSLSHTDADWRMLGHQAPQLLQPDATHPPAGSVSLVLARGLRPRRRAAGG